jgi:hypothetical protein
MSTSDEILAAFSTLSPSDKWTLLGRFWEQLSPEDWPAPPEEEISLLDARFAEFELGAVQAISREEVQRQLREHLNRHV